MAASASHVDLKAKAKRPSNIPSEQVYCFLLLFPSKLERLKLLSIKSKTLLHVLYGREILCGGVAI